MGPNDLLQVTLLPCQKKENQTIKQIQRLSCIIMDFIRVSMMIAYLGELGKKQSMRKESKTRGTMTINNVETNLQSSYNSSAKMLRVRVPIIIIKKLNLSNFILWL